jgi:hypothetical protein
MSKSDDGSVNNNSNNRTFQESSMPACLDAAFSGAVLLPQQPFL